MALPQEGFGIRDVALLAQFLAEIQAQGGQGDADLLLREVFGEGQAPGGVHHDELVRIRADDQVIAGGEQLRRLGAHHGHASFVVGHDVAADPGKRLRVGPLAEGRDHLVGAVEEDIEVFPAQLRAVVFHPLAQVEVVVADHREGGYFLHR